MIAFKNSYERFRSHKSWSMCASLAAHLNHCWERLKLWSSAWASDTYFDYKLLTKTSFARRPYRRLLTGGYATPLLESTCAWTRKSRSHNLSRESTQNLRVIHKNMININYHSRISSCVFLSALLSQRFADARLPGFQSWMKIRHSGQQWGKSPFYNDAIFSDQNTDMIQFGCKLIWLLLMSV